jgi:retron-type reverse transcriptase
VKTIKNLYPEIYDFENLYISYIEARRDKRVRDEVLEFTESLEENLFNLHNHLIHQTYKVGKYSEHISLIPKKRLIMALPFRDRVIQWAIYRNLYPLYAPSYIDTSYGSVRGKGPLLASEKVQYWLRMYHNKPGDLYALKMDITKFFFRVPHDVLMKVIRKKIADEQVLWLLETIIRSKQTPFGFPLEVTDIETTERLWDIGMPVGNLISQLFANIVMNEFDQYVKRDLKVKHYARYMDDMVAFDQSEQKLKELRVLSEMFLENELGLNLNRKTSIHKITHGIEFAGYRIWHNKIQIRKSTTLRMKRNLRGVKILYESGQMPLEKAQRVLCSYIGMMKHCQNDALRDKILEEYAMFRHDTDDWI